MRPLFKIIIAVFIVLIALAVASQVRGKEKPISPTLVVPNEGPKIYVPGNQKGTWVSLVNFLMTNEKWYDVHDHEVYHQGFALNDESCTLAYNHTNGTLTMTINKLTHDSVRIMGKGNKITTEKSKEITVLTMVSINFDTIPDLAIWQHIVLDSLGTKQIGTSAVFTVIPQAKLHPLRQKREMKMQIDYLKEWATWEMHIMNTLGFEMVIPPKKEKM